MPNHWIEKQIQLIKSYQGMVIQKVMIFDMAIIESDDGNHLFEHSACPFIQAQVLYLWFSGLGVVKFYTYQNDCDWGIYSSMLTDVNELNDEPKARSIYRMRPCYDFPLGKVECVDVLQNDNGDIAEIMLGIKNRQILLKTGEVEEVSDDKVIVRDNDESVLIFLNAKDVNKFNFNIIVSLS